MSSISGQYHITRIDLKYHYIIIEEENSARQPLRVFYEADTLLAEMEDIKNSLHNPIDNEHKIFTINATIFKDGDTITYILQNIK